LAFVILLHLFALAKSLTSERPAEPEEPPRSGGDEREFACYTLARVRIDYFQVFLDFSNLLLIEPTFSTLKKFSSALPPPRSPTEPWMARSEKALFSLLICAFNFLRFIY